MLGLIVSEKEHKENCSTLFWLHYSLLNRLGVHICTVWESHYLVSTKTAQEKLKNYGFYKFWSVKIGSVICMVSTNIAFITSIEYHYMRVEKHGIVDHIFRKAGTFEVEISLSSTFKRNTYSTFSKRSLEGDWQRRFFFFFQENDRKCEYHHEM